MNNKPEECVIAVLEDETLVAMDIQLRLESFNYKNIKLFSLAAELLAFIEKNCPDLILLDINLKDGINGLELAEKIKSSSDTPFVFITALSDIDTLNRIRVLAPYGYILKPFSDAQLLSTVEIALFKSRTEKALKAAEKKLKHEKAVLEKKVSERTRKLKIANTELKRAGRLKDEFLANMSHELRSPLNNIQSVAELMKEQILGPLNEEQLRLLSRIEDNSRHLLSLINDVLDISKIEAGRLILNFRPVNINEICTSCINIIAQSAAKKGIQICTDYLPDPGTLIADELRLKQIIVNLLSNAVKFTEKGKKTGIRTWSDSKMQILNISVWDEGTGIEKDVQEKVFAPFVQADSSLKRQHEGTGLGLSLAQKLAVLHGGKINLSSEKDKGSTFTLSIPLIKARDYCETLDKTVQELFVSEKPGSKGSSSLFPLILIADDNTDNTDVLAVYFQAKGYSIIKAENGKEAVIKARKNHPDIIIMDISMPVMDGYTAINLIRKDSSLKAVFIIAATALAMPGDREKCMSAGADEYLSKPFHIKELLQLCEKLMNSRSAAEIIS